MSKKLVNAAKLQSSGSLSTKTLKNSTLAESALTRLNQSLEQFSRYLQKHNFFKELPKCRTFFLNKDYMVCI